MKNTGLSTSLIGTWAGFVIALLASEFVPAVILTHRRLSWLQKSGTNGIFTPLVALCIALSLQVICCFWIFYKLHRTYSDAQHYTGTFVLIGTIIIAVFLAIPWGFILMPMAKISSSTDAMAMVYWAEGLRLPMHFLVLVPLIRDHVEYGDWREEYEDSRTFTQFVNILYPVPEPDDE